MSSTYVNVVPKDFYYHLRLRLLVRWFYVSVIVILVVSERYRADDIVMVYRLIFRFILRSFLIIMISCVTG